MPDWWNVISTMFLLTNTILAFFVLFIERKRAASKWAWVMVLMFLPLLGLLLYLLFGQPYRKNKKRYTDTYQNPDLENLSKQQLGEIDKGSFSFPSAPAEEWRHLIRMNMKSETAPFTQNNQLKIFNDGKRKFEALFRDIEAAKIHIHMEYYIIKDDELGRSLLELLTKKAKQGVQVLVLYDDIGSKSLPGNFFHDFNQAGGRAAASLPSKLPVANLRVNHRNHRKITIIDGKAGYIGGFNVGDEYLGKNGKFGYWRDTHVRIEGGAVHSLQHRFLSDWNETSTKHPVVYEESYFPAVKNSAGAGVQLIASGPDESLDQIKNGYLRMISGARQSVYIQTPYLIPDMAVSDALSTAALAGADVRLMIPSIADHIFVHSASLSYARDLMAAGVKVYRYGNGFLHAKTVVVDGKVSSIGSANMDVRSFSLNYEANVFIYDVETAEEMMLLFENDIRLSEELTTAYFDNLSLIHRFRLQVAQLVAPIL